MDMEAFEKMLGDEGYKAVSRQIEPNLAIDEHDHAWDTKGMVLRGSFTITSEISDRTYGPGEIFELAAGIPHTEGTGADGADLLVGRRTVAD